MTTQELVTQITDSYREGKEHGRDEEREAVVRYLRGMAEAAHAGADGRGWAAVFADDIERGEHRKEAHEAIADDDMQRLMRERGF